MYSEYGSHNRYDNPLNTLTILPVVKMCLGSVNTVSTSFVVVKTGLQNNYRPSTTFVAVKTVFMSTSTGLQRASWQSNCLVKLLQSLCGSQNGFVEPLQAVNWLCSCQNVFSEHIKAFNRPCGSETCMTIFHRHSTGFTVVNTIR